VKKPTLPRPELTPQLAEEEYRVDEHGREVLKGFAKALRRPSSIEWLSPREVTDSQRTKEDPEFHEVLVKQLREMKQHAALMRKHRSEETIAKIEQFYERRQDSNSVRGFIVRADNTVVRWDNETEEGKESPVSANGDNDHKPFTKIQKSKKKPQLRKNAQPRLFSEDKNDAENFEKKD